MKKIFMTGMILLAASTSVFASPVRGDRFAQDVVNGYSNIAYHETFYANEDTVITLTGSCVPGQDIDLWVYDENGNLVGKSVTYGCYEFVSVNPQWTGDFKIVVENSNHPFPTSFRLEMN